MLGLLVGCHMHLYFWDHGRFKQRGYSQLCNKCFTPSSLPLQFSYDDVDHAGTCRTSIVPLSCISRPPPLFHKEWNQFTRVEHLKVLPNHYLKAPPTNNTVSYGNKLQHKFGETHTFNPLSSMNTRRCILLDFLVCVCVDTQMSWQACRSQKRTVGYGSAIYPRVPRSCGAGSWEARSTAATCEWQIVYLNGRAGGGEKISQKRKCWGWLKDRNLQAY